MRPRTVCDDEWMADRSSSTRTAFRTCPLCEASCGLEITLRPDGRGGEEVQRIRGDRLDVFSKGFICPKGSTLKQLHEDPDRLRTPMIKRDGVHVPATWDEAWSLIDERLGACDRRSRAWLARGVRGQSDGAQPVGDDLLAGAAHRARHQTSLQCVDRRPDAATRRLGLRVRLAGGDPGARSRSHRPSGDPRSEPVCVERQRVHRAGLPGSHRGDAGQGRQAGRRRPPPVAYGAGSGRMGVDPSGHRCAAAGCHRSHDDRGGARRPGRSPGRARRRTRRADRGTCTLHARVRCGRDRRRGRHDPSARPRDRRGTERSGVRPYRHHHHRVRLDGIVVDRRGEHSQRQSRPPGRIDVPHPGGRRGHDPWQAGFRPGVLASAAATAG